jgi:hypothetical protein
MGGHEETIGRIIEEKGAREAFHRLVLPVHDELSEIWTEKSTEFMDDHFDSSDLSVSSGAAQLEFLGWVCDIPEIKKSDGLKAKCKEIALFLGAR